jgi:hypothetical protein
MAQLTTGPRSLGYQAALISYVSIFSTFPVLALKYDGNLEAIMKFIGRLGICPIIFVAVITIMPFYAINTANYELNKLYIRKKRGKKPNVA